MIAFVVVLIYLFVDIFLIRCHTGIEKFIDTHHDLLLQIPRQDDILQCYRGLEINIVT